MLPAISSLPSAAVSGYEGLMGGSAPLLTLLAIAVALTLLAIVECYVRNRNLPRGAK